jgi:hypothetical protein
MADLNEHHRRKILTTVQYADELLSESLDLLGSAGGALCPRYIRDLSTADSQWVESCAGNIRRQMGQLLQRFGIAVSPPGFRASWALRTKLISLDIAFENLRPHKMRGFGEMDPEASKDLTGTLKEVHQLVSQLLVFLAGAGTIKESGLD